MEKFQNPNDLRFIMLVGIAGSGKSTFALDILEERDDTVHLSSDAIREEIHGDVNVQDNPAEVFNQMAIRTKEALKQGKHVIYDATNISRKKRKGLLQQLPKTVHKTVVYMASTFETIKKQNSNRERKVPEEVLHRMHISLQTPIKSEGWDNIYFFHDEETLNNELPKQFSDAVRAGVLFNREGLDPMNFLATYFDEFFKVLDMPQDSKWHSLSVSRHIYYVYKHVLDNYDTEDETEKEMMLWTALLHDVGKHATKSFMNRKGEETRYASFIGHEYVSSQLAINFLKRMGFDDDFIYSVATLIQFHMYLLNENANKEKLVGYVGEKMYKQLEFLREADTLAH